MWGKGNLIHYWWECKLMQPLWKKIWRLLKKSKHRSAIWSSNPTPKYIPKGMQHRLLQRHVDTHVYCSTIHNSQVMETNKMTHYWWIKIVWFLAFQAWLTSLKVMVSSSIHLLVNDKISFFLDWYLLNVYPVPNSVILHNLYLVSMKHFIEIMV
jgi:hypothetical protein